MRNFGGLTKMRVVLLVAVWSSETRADPADATARSLMAAWKDADPNMAAVAEVIASVFASGMSWVGRSKPFPSYCPPQAAALTGPQLMAIVERFIADNPDSADKTYGYALSAGLCRAFPCAPG